MNEISLDNTAHNSVIHIADPINNTSQNCYIPFTPWVQPAAPQPQYHWVYTNYTDSMAMAKIDKLEAEILALKEIVIALANHLGIGKK